MSNDPSIPSALKFAQLQMAAEAIIRSDNDVLHASGPDLANVHREGNGHASRYPSAQAADFASHWKVLDQRKNAGTGFSGTLFQCIAADPVTGAQVGEKVISFRSTEFIDDEARDNQATNQMEIAQFGFAFGHLCVGLGDTSAKAA